MEDYRVFIKRSETKEQGANAANQLLFTLLQAQLIDAPTFASLFNRATPDSVAEGLRKYQSDKLMAQQKMDQAQNQGMIQQRNQEAQMMEGMMEAQQQQEASQIANQEMLHDQEMEKIALKEVSVEP